VFLLFISIFLIIFSFYLETQAAVSHSFLSFSSLLFFSEEEREKRKRNGKGMGLPGNLSCELASGDKVHRG
jgi:hypothetical protein